MTSILIVDDSEAFRAQIRGFLESGGYKVTEACNGADGLKKLQTQSPFKMILCDVNMPEMNGLEMCKRVREDEVLKTVPVLMLTTDGSLELKRKGKEVGVKGWMTKPVDRGHLLDAVKKIIGEGE